jgi:hypothetical protein
MAIPVPVARRRKPQTTLKESPMSIWMQELIALCNGLLQLHGHPAEPRVRKDDHMITLTA